VPLHLFINTINGSFQISIQSAIKSNDLLHTHIHSFTYHSRFIPEGYVKEEETIPTYKIMLAEIKHFWK
jgi:hypothetical protein